MESHEIPTSSKRLTLHSFALDKLSRADPGFDVNSIETLVLRPQAPKYDFAGILDPTEETIAQFIRASVTFPIATNIVVSHLPPQCIPHLSRVTPNAESLELDLINVTSAEQLIAAGKGIADGFPQLKRLAMTMEDRVWEGKLAKFWDFSALSDILKPLLGLKHLQVLEHQFIGEVILKDMTGARSIQEVRGWIARDFGYRPQPAGTINLRTIDAQKLWDEVMIRLHRLWPSTVPVFISSDRSTLPLMYSVAMVACHAGLFAMCLKTIPLDPKQLDDVIYEITHVDMCRHLVASGFVDLTVEAPRKYSFVPSSSRLYKFIVGMENEDVMQALLLDRTVEWQGQRITPCKARLPASNPGFSFLSSEGSLIAAIARKSPAWFPRKVPLISWLLNHKQAIVDENGDDFVGSLEDIDISPENRSRLSSYIRFLNALHNPPALDQILASDSSMLLLDSPSQWPFIDCLLRNEANRADRCIPSVAVALKHLPDLKLSRQIIMHPSNHRFDEICMLLLRYWTDNEPHADPSFEAVYQQLFKLADEQCLESLAEKILSYDGSEYVSPIPPADHKIFAQMAEPLCGLLLRRATSTPDKRTDKRTQEPDYKAPLRLRMLMHRLKGPPPPQKPLLFAASPNGVIFRAVCALVQSNNFALLCQEWHDKKTAVFPQHWLVRYSQSKSIDDVGLRTVMAVSRLFAAQKFSHDSMDENGKKALDYASKI